MSFMFIRLSLTGLSACPSRRKVSKFRMIAEY